jgi:hypothetical protein
MDRHCSVVRVSFATRTFRRAVVVALVLVGMYVSI